MTVLDLDIEREPLFDPEERRSGGRFGAGLGRSGRYIARVRHAARRLATEDLPADVRDEEVSVIVCFQGSVLLNVILGGADDMTFSARCHFASRRARRRRRVVRWMVWATLSGGIDLLCAVLRGEREHCATAWDNHLARPR